VAHPDIEYVIADGPAPGRWTGVDGLAEGWRSWLSAFEDFRAEAEDYLEIDEERILVPLRKVAGPAETSLVTEETSLVTEETSLVTEPRTKGRERTPGPSELQSNYGLRSASD